ncbi:MAG: stage IV sporulation protein A, partial [Clostridiales bacterium]|nr:stage IV sporulation protein A [Clostridiales bacterium]
MDQQTLYRDIAERTEGDIYIGVVGPVRTGKSTFIKRFMELLVLPNIVGEHRRERAIDELPQSGAGRTIMTTQPKFVPNEAVEVSLRESASFRVRLVDCVGYLIRGVLGTQEGESARMVRTPWYDHDIPFEDAAEEGTRRVIAEHSTLGLVVTTDGSITDIPRSAYVDAEERVVKELKARGKPFAMVLNTRTPGELDTQRLRDALAEKYAVPVVQLDVLNMELGDVNRLLEEILFEFPLTEVFLETPSWMAALPADHWVNQAVLGAAHAAAGSMARVRDHRAVREAFSALAEVGQAELEGIELNRGAVGYRVAPAEGLFFRVLSEASGQQIDDEEHLMTLLTQLVMSKREYDRVADALAAVRETGYGMVAPEQSELTLETPEIARQGGRFGVKL